MRYHKLPNSLATPTERLSLQRLTQAACRIQSLTSVAELVQAITDEARLLIGAHRAVTQMILPENNRRPVHAASVSDESRAVRGPASTVIPAGVELHLRRTQRPLRLTHTELTTDPAWRHLHRDAKFPPPRGCLAVPLVNPEGGHVGILHLTDKYEGDFDTDDEALLLHFGHLAAVAVANAWLYQALEVANQALLQRLHEALPASSGVKLAGGTSLPASLQRLAETLLHQERAACAQIWLGADDPLELHVSSPSRTPRIPAASARALGASLVERILATRRPYCTNFLTEDPHFAANEWVRREGLSACAGQPIFIDSAFAGIVALFDRKPLPAAVMDPLAAAARTIAAEVVRHHPDPGGPALLRQPFSKDVAMNPEASHDEADLLRDQQQCALRLEALGQLVSSVAHDFNNLLTVILGSSEMLLFRAAPHDAARPFLSEIHQAGVRAEALTQQLASLSRQREPDVRTLDLNQIVADAEAPIRRLLGDDVRLTLLRSPGLRSVKADPAQMQQVLLHLAMNARAAMPQGGSLTFETANVPLEESAAVGPGRYVLLTVRDSGIGMDPLTTSRLFEPLLTPHDAGQGKGLGLTLVQTIVKKCGGHLAVASEMGRGSTFKIYLPQAEPALATDPTLQSHALTLRRQETVLLVEDEDSVRMLAHRVLQNNGYLVLEARNGEEAIHLAKTHLQPIHLLVSDVVMPHLGGYQLAERLLVQHPEMKLLFLSGYPSETLDDRYLQTARYAFLQKPFSTNVLLQKVREVLSESEGE